MNLPDRLHQHVAYLAGEIGRRSPLYYPNLERARAYIEASFSESGYPIRHDTFQIQDQVYRNVIVERHGSAHPDQTLVVGAHYDTVSTTPGADDNASGVAALIETARMLVTLQPAVTIRFVAFTLEEPPHFRTSFMGSRVHARNCRERGENLIGMLSLEMVGYFSREKNSQGYPLPLMRWFYPSAGDFIAVAGNFQSRGLVHRLAQGLSQQPALKVEWTALPLVPGVGLSDNWAFWKEGYEAVMVTDTSFFRNPHYHLLSDRPETLDYQEMAVLVTGLVKVLADWG